MSVSRRRLLHHAGIAVTTLGLADTAPGLNSSAASAKSANPQESANKEQGKQKPMPEKVNPVNIVLVHGQFADGSSWDKVIPLLLKQGYNVTAVQNPMTSVADDVATTRRVLEAQVGPTVVVAHSYGGCVITQAAHNMKNIKALVYLAAFAPEVGQTNGEMLAPFGEPPVAKLLRPDSAGFLYIDRSAFHAAFCADLSAEEASVMAVTQKPAAGVTFAEKCVAAAWKEFPTFYQISEEDKTLKPEMQEALAKRMNATILRLKSSHVSFKSHPKEVAAFIGKAAQS